jgi:hypothetical protein
MFIFRRSIIVPLVGLAVPALLVLVDVLYTVATR